MTKGAKRKVGGEPPTLNGQWYGPSAATSEHVIANIDRVGPSTYRGTLCIQRPFPIPWFVGSFRLKAAGCTFSFEVREPAAVQPTSGLHEPWDTMKQYYPGGTAFPKVVSVTGSWDAAVLSLSWATDTGDAGKCWLPRSRGNMPSELKALNKNWSAFKKHVGSLEGKRYLFRGQSAPWRLRTSFHRTGRADFTRFLEEDVMLLYQQVCARTKHIFNIDNARETGALYGLVQHHGYPTPLPRLDVLSLCCGLLRVSGGSEGKHI